MDGLSLIDFQADPGVCQGLSMPAMDSMIRTSIDPCLPFTNKSSLEVYCVPSSIRDLPSKLAGICHNIQPEEHSSRVLQGSRGRTCGREPNVAQSHELQLVQTLVSNLEHEH